MSAKVFPLLAMSPENYKPEDIKSLHYVPEGQDVCAACGQHKLQMRFHYTDEAKFWAHYRDHEPTAMVGMWSESDHAVVPYFFCDRRTTGEAELREHLSAAAHMGLIDGNAVH